MFVRPTCFEDLADLKLSFLRTEDMVPFTCSFRDTS